MAFGIIYKYTNTENKKVYIGQTTRPTIRKRAHERAQEDTAFHESIRYWGREKFSYEVLAECESQEDLNAAEIRLIRQFKADQEDFGYNQTSGGTYSKWTPSAREKASAAQISVRARKIRDLAYKNYTITDISRILLLKVESIRRIAEEAGVPVLDDVWSHVFADRHADYIRYDIPHEIDGEAIKNHKPDKGRSVANRAVVRHFTSKPDLLLIEEYSPQIYREWEDED